MLALVLGLNNMTEVGIRGMAMATKSKAQDSWHEETPGLPKLTPTAPAARTARLLEVCVELLELCIECTGTIDPVAARLVSHAKDEVTFGVNGVRHDRSY